MRKMRYIKLLFSIGFLVMAIWASITFATGHIREDTVKEVIFTSFCINGNVSGDYGAGSRYTTFPGRSTTTWTVSAATYPGTNCTNDTEIVFIGFEVPSGLAAGDRVCLWDHDPAPTVDCRDTTPPTISSLTAGSITQTGATVTWTTNESATHTIKYGTSSGSYDSYPNTKAAGSGTSASGVL